MNFQYQPIINKEHIIYINNMEDDLEMNKVDFNKNDFDDNIIYKFKQIIFNIWNVVKG